MVYQALKQVVVAVALIGAVSAVSADDSKWSFKTIEGSAFLDSFLVTPSETNSLELSLSGLKADYSSLSFEIIGGAFTKTVHATSNGKQWVASFNDEDFKGLDLTGGTAYTLKISGFTKVNKDKNNFGTYSLKVEDGSFRMVSLVPEPESFAMLLAGLGIVGAIARRRTPANAI